MAGRRAGMAQRLECTHWRILLLLMAPTVRSHQFEVPTSMQLLIPPSRKLSFISVHPFIESVCQCIVLSQIGRIRLTTIFITIWAVGSAIIQSALLYLRIVFFILMRSIVVLTLRAYTLVLQQNNSVELRLRQFNK